MAAATINVPASIRSGIIVNSVPCNFFLPLMITVLVPAPSIDAPLATKNLARSVTSGSYCEVRPPSIPKLQFSSSANSKLTENKGINLYF